MVFFTYLDKKMMCQWYLPTSEYIARGAMLFVIPFGESLIWKVNLTYLIYLPFDHTPNYSVDRPYFYLTMYLPPTS